MWLIIFLVISITQAEQELCKERCSRIHQRSLARVGFDAEKLRQLLEKQRPFGTMKDLCWRVYDHLDCMKHCKLSESHEAFAKFVRTKCQFALRAIESALLCVSRYHSFMEVRCSTFLNEAQRLKKEMDPSSTPTQEICRFLHLNTLCLENTVTMYCVNAKKIFRRLNFRDYFLSFILPTNDTLLDDIDLDACQMFDFVKKNSLQPDDDHLDRELTTVVNFIETNNAIIRPVITSTFATTLKERKVFTALLDELLEESPTTPQTRVLFNPPATTQMTTTTRSRPTEEGTTVAITTTVDTTTTKSTSTTTTAASTSKPILFSVIQPTENIVKEEYDDSADETKDVVVNMAPNQRIRSSISGILPTMVETPTTPTLPKSRLFSDDSWEQTPPNFHYSSLRLSNGGVTPLDIDTTTLFGFDDHDNDDDDREGDTDDNNNIADNDDKNKKSYIKQISTETSTRQQKAVMREKLEISPTNSTRWKNDMLTGRRNKQPENIRESTVTVPTVPMTEDHDKAVLLEGVLESDGENRNAFESPTIRQTFNEKLNLLRPHSTLSPSSVPVYDGVVKTNIQDWDEYDRNAKDGTYDVGRLVESGAEEDEEVLYPLDHTEALMTVENSSSLPDVKENWFSDETLMLINCIIFGVTSFAIMFLLMCLVWCRKSGQSTSKN